MNLHLKLIGSTLMIVTGLGLAHAIASEPTASSANQHMDLCQQAGAEYRQLYTIEEATRSITICQKGDQYYHITTLKQPQQNSISSLNIHQNQASAITRIK